MILYKVHDETGYADRWFKSVGPAKKYLNSLKGTYDSADLTAVSFRFKRGNKDEFIVELLNRASSFKDVEAKYTLLEKRDFFEEIIAPWD